MAADALEAEIRAFVHSANRCASGRFRREGRQALTVALRIMADIGPAGENGLTAMGPTGKPATPTRLLRLKTA